ncbi:MAG: pyruvate kinase [candidate division KSB1 bacterium]|nr:pyruvate kinase [candidate division KSB1 bacterium]
MLNLQGRRTKIVCTLGPATNSPERIAALIDAGMNVARINFSHGTHEEHERTIGLVREIAAQKHVPVAVLQDLSGPKIRIDEMKAPVELKPGQRFSLFRHPRPGDEHGVSTNYPDLVTIADVGDTIMLADGVLSLRVVGKKPDELVCEVLVGGRLSSHKGINLPTRSLPVPSLTEKDKHDLELGIRLTVDYIALSFVRKPGDVLKLKGILNRAGAKIPVIAKIEKHEALQAIDAIIDAADGIMVARGDLAVETPLEQVPIVQKQIIAKCNRLARPVITATQMLKSMVEQPRPTRAEAADVANAVLDGTDAVMLSEETAVGQYPVETVRTMHRILIATEQEFTESATMIQLHNHNQEFISVPAAVSRAAVVMGHELQASAIVTPTRSGATAKMVSCYRPRLPIVALCTREEIQKQLCLVWGVYPYMTSELSDSDTVFQIARRTAKQNGFVRSGQKIIITAGLPIGTRGKTNLIKVDEID